jgi:alpha-tubulin suppressor-like RCC1 family protein
VSGVTDLQCRQDVYCGRIGNSGVVCWGDARHFGTFDQPYSFDLPGVSAIAEGNDHVCGIIADGEVACWGWNRDGQLGNGTQTDAYLPTKVPSVTGAISIAAGPTFTCVLLDTGRVSCWGQKFTDSSGSLLPMTLPW